MRSFILISLFCMACLATASGQSNNTFLKIITNFKRGYTICPAGDGNLYVGGAVIGRTALLKIAPNGDILSSDFLDFDTGNLDNLSELIVDSDGMIAGCGTQGTEDIRRGFVFRYNPLTKTILWASTLDMEVATLSGLLEKTPGGNYVVYGEIFYPTGSDALMLQVKRSTGALLSPLTRHYHLGKNESFNAIVKHDSTLYAVGRGSSGMSIFTDLFVRSALTRLDTLNGTPVWTRMSGAPLAASGYLRGRDLIVDGDAFVVTYSGNTSDPSLSTTTFFLQKHHLDGTIEWRKKYDLTEWNNEIAEELIRVPDGYVLYGRASNSGGSSLFVLKTNLQGEFLWANKLHYGANDGFAQTESQQGQIVALGNSLFFTGTTEQTNGISRMLLAKTDANGSMGDSCSYWSATPVVVSVPAGLPDASVTLQVNADIMPLVAAPRTASLSVPASVVTACQMETLLVCGDTLNLGPDVILCRDSMVTFHAGGGFVTYLWQDGSTDSIYTASVPDVYWVAVTDTCGVIQRDSVLLTVSLLADTQLSDTTICPGQSLTYTVPGFDTYLWTPAAGLDCDTCATVILQPTTTTTYTLLAQTSAGCVLTDTFSVAVSLLAAAQLPDATICPGESLTYSVPGFDVYQWAPAAGLSCDTCATVLLQPAATTTYTLLAQNGAGCTLADTFTVAVIVLPNVDLPDTTLCPGESLTYSVPGFSTYWWTPAAGVNCDTCATVIIQPAATTTYTLLAQNSAGCVLTDTFTVAVSVLPNVRLRDTTLCPGESVTYVASGFSTYLWTPAAGVNCDTCATVIIQPAATTTYTLLAQNSAGCVLTDTFTVAVSLLSNVDLPDTMICPGESLTYTVPGFDTYLWSPAAGLNCTTCPTVIVQPATTTTYTLLAQTSSGCTLADTFTVAVSMLPNVHLRDTTLCPGQSATYVVSGFDTYLWTPAAGVNCDTCATVIIQPTATTTYTLLAQNSAGCMLTDTFTVAVNVLASLLLADSAICPGESVSYSVSGFNSYVWAPAAGLNCTTCATVIAQPATTTTYTLLAQNSAGCFQTDTFTVTVLPLPARTEIIKFLPGTVVTLGGVNYTQPGTVLLTLPATVGCDTLVTYILQLQTTATIACPNPVLVSIPSGDSLAIVDYTLPTAVTDCPGGALTFMLLTPIPGGNLFPLGVTEICYRVHDACGNSATCCFDVVVMQQVPPCDVKVNGCLRYELLSIKLDSLGNRRYTIRVINNCAEALQYAAFEVPSGVVAVAPAEGAVFTAISGRMYDVHNPNFSPFYSVRFKARPGTLLQGGAADVFEYKLPQQSAPAYLHVTAKLVNNQSYPAILNTFDCPVQPYPNLQTDPNTEQQRGTYPLLFPNPTDGILFANLSAWVGQTVELRITNAQGQWQQTRTLVADDLPQAVEALDILPNGLYFLEIHPVGGQWVVQRLVIQR